MHTRTNTVKIGQTLIGDGHFALIAGPCSIENKEILSETSKSVQNSGANLLRGGIFKLRTSPNSFQGLGSEAFEAVRLAKEETGLPFISEVTDPRQISDLMPLLDAFQVGSRNMHNYELLKELGKTDKPIILKRGFSGLIKEWILAAEYITSAGNDQVILCERGIRTFETATRNTFDINAIAYVKENCSFPIIADPSHGTGKTSLVKPISLAAIAAGADGLMIEVHPQPAQALSDGFQTLNFNEFQSLVHHVKQMLPLFSKTLEA
ncbi:MAG: 3-deoxy-7-phosphoheptulonate synthase [Bdellovibrionaceae bacterium]|jgi:3-deoxy-7-phosphoheptulonate synthase|nr:3-deoxy-7-phosphoheptulonate synthase [Pseudobdellovibrionaceae bacterium]